MSFGIKVLQEAVREDPERYAPLIQRTLVECLPLIAGTLDPPDPRLHHRVRPHRERDPAVRDGVAQQATASDRHQPGRLTLHRSEERDVDGFPMRSGWACGGGDRDHPHLVGNAAACVWPKRRHRSWATIAQAIGTVLIVIVASRWCGLTWAEAGIGRTDLLRSTLIGAGTGLGLASMAPDCLRSALNSGRRSPASHCMGRRRRLS